MTTTAKHSLSKLNQIINERKQCGFPVLVNELINEIAIANRIDPEYLSDLYYGFA